jgi:hypothetical protein
MATIEETLRKLGLAAARGVPQLATGFVDLAALPFTMTGVMKPEQAVGSTAYLTSKGLLPPPQEGLLSETTELVSSAMNPATATKAALAKGGLLVAPMLSVGKKATSKIPAVDEKIGLPSPQSLSMPDVPTVDQMKQYGRVETVPLSKAVSFQGARNWEKFKSGKHPGDLVAGYGDKPLALRLETGEYVIYDGNHRTDLALRKGKTELPMHVIDVKSYDPAHAGRKPAKQSMTDDELLSVLLGK